MHAKKNLTRKQISIINDLFTGESEEDEILEKHKVSPAVFNKWLTDENFKNEFVRRIEWLNLQSQALVARYTSTAAIKLVELTESKNSETARKACLDIISLPKTNPLKPANQSEHDNNSPPQLSPQTAGKILEIMANEKNN